MIGYCIRCNSEYMEFSNGYNNAGFCSEKCKDLQNNDRASGQNEEIK